MERVLLSLFGSESSTSAGTPALFESTAPFSAPPLGRCQKSSYSYHLEVRDTFAQASSAAFASLKVSPTSLVDSLVSFARQRPHVQQHFAEKVFLRWASLSPFEMVELKEEELLELFSEEDLDELSIALARRRAELLQSPLPGLDATKEKTLLQDSWNSLNQKGAQYIAQQLALSHYMLMRKLQLKDLFSAPPSGNLVVFLVKFPFICSAYRWLRSIASCNVI